jgi:lycopene beta-cyclase
MGGGVAAHLYALVAASRWGASNIDVTMVDPAEHAPDRNLCVWGAPIPMLEDAVIAEWRTLRFGYSNATIVRDLTHVSYRHYSAQSIRRVVDRTIDVHRIIARSDAPEPTSDVSLDSRPNAAFQRPATISLVQHFHGWHIRTAGSVFDPHVMTMMDFRTDQRNGVCFVYVLPYSDNEALVECTVFSAHEWDIADYERHLRTYIADVLNCTSYDVLSTETGAIPMCDAIPVRERGNRWLAIGSAAGLTKPTTGYTVARCIRDAEQMIDGYRATGEWTAPARANRRFDFYDRLLLRIIRDEPQHISHILWTLFERNPVEVILRFLDEQTTLREEIRLFWSLPWNPFLRALFRR